MEPSSEATSDRASGARVIRHVALFVPTLEGGGAERTMVNLANAFAVTVPRVDLVVAHARGPFGSEVTADVRLVDLGRRRTAASLPGLIAYLRREQPDVLLSTLNHANIVAVLAGALSSAPTAIFVREANTLSRNIGAGAPLRARLVGLLTRLVYPWATGIIAPSFGVAEDLAQVLGTARVDVVENPVLCPHFETRLCEPVAHPFFEIRGESVILAVGRLEAQKDFGTLIHALAQVRRETGRGRLIILGEGSDRRSLEALVAELDLSEYVSLPGFVDNPFPYMARARLFVLSSTHEGLPNVLIQALAAGCPVVSTDCESGPREILDGGRLGRLVPVHDPTELARAMADALSDDTGAVDASARRQASTRFSAARIAERYLARFAEAPSSSEAA